MAEATAAVADPLLQRLLAVWDGLSYPTRERLVEAAEAADAADAADAASMQWTGAES